PDLRPRSKVFEPMDLLRPDQVDRPRAMKDTPALIKAYLRLGGVIGEGAYIDHAFNTVDVCLVLDTARMPAKHRDIYTRARR
ncbi:MAG: ornithine-acyl-ACP acyltransferase, partial [Pseudomonadota bacterium]